MAVKKDIQNLPKGITLRADGNYMGRFSYYGERYTLYDKDVKKLQKKLEELRYELEHGLYAKENKITINFIKSNMFENILEEFDIIVSNPPYIKTKIIGELSKDVQNEPHIALDGGEDGLKYYRIIAENIDRYLKKDGVLVLEIGYDQKEEVTQIFRDSKCIKDYENRDRVVIWNHSQGK